MLLFHTIAIVHFQFSFFHCCKKKKNEYNLTTTDTMNEQQNVDGKQTHFITILTSM